MAGENNERQVKADRPVQRTLDKVQFAKFSDKVIERVSPITQANEKVRAKSLAKAGHHVLRPAARLNRQRIIERQAVQKAG